MAVKPKWQGNYQTLPSFARTLMAAELGKLIAAKAIERNVKADLLARLEMATSLGKNGNIEFERATNTILSLEINVGKAKLNRMARQAYQDYEAQIS